MWKNPIHNISSLHRMKQRIFVSLKKNMEKESGSRCAEIWTSMNSLSTVIIHHISKDPVVTSYADVSVERRIDREAYVGICEDTKVGINLVFYLQNMMEYLRERQLGGRSIKYSSVTLSGLCNEGTILLPVLKSKEQEREQQEDVHNRMLLLSAAKSGDPQAIESLTLDDIDTYSKVSRRLISEDVFTIVDTYIMPYGIECDRYSIMGEILEYRLTRNEITREDICIMKLDVNGLLFDVCVPKREVMGEPAVGRRFKGNVWLQGRINF